jgi:preprotein translocase subunit SecG
LEKQVNAQPSQDNRRNMVNKLEKEKTVAKLAPQQQKKVIHHKKEERANIDEKIEYARSVFLNARRHTLRMVLVTRVVISTTQKQIQMANSSSSSPRATLFKTRSKVSTALTIFLMLMRLIFLICLIMILMHSMFL